MPLPRQLLTIWRVTSPPTLNDIWVRITPRRSNVDIPRMKMGYLGLSASHPQTMADSAALQTPSEIESEVVIDGVYNDIASVRVYSSRWVDFLHIAKARGKWRLFQVTWHPRNTATE